MFKSVAFILLCSLSNNVLAKIIAVKESTVPLQAKSGFYSEIRARIRQEGETVVLISSRGYFASQTMGKFANLLYPCSAIIIMDGPKKLVTNPNVAHKSRYIFLFVDTVEEIHKWLKYSDKNSLWNVRAYFHFIICNPVQHHLSLIFTFGQIWKKDILHFLIIYRHKNLETILTYNPFLEKIVDLTKLDARSGIYKNKLRNMNGFPLRVSFFADPPRIIEKDGLFYGIDAMIMVGLARRFNATLEIVRPTYSKTIDEKYMRHFLQVKGRKCDFGLVSCFA